MRSTVHKALAGLLLLAGCQATERGATVGDKSAPRIFDGMGSHRRTVTTRSKQAQQFFNQGLVWAYSFNHDEAIRSFQEATRQDPNCAMAWWGIALCNGPHINNPVVDEAHAKAAWDALQKAIALRDRANATERALINALAKRYAQPQPADRRPLDEAYVQAMRVVWAAHSSDADVGTLLAESLMDLQPWDLWTQDGQAKGNTNEILALLERVLAIEPNHPGANHLYIHAVEASPNPEKGIASADRLRRIVPVSGHMVHMPSHIDVQVGQWAQAAKQNEQAIEADREYRALSPRQGFYNVYMAHNPHFLSFASMMEGRSAVALKAARDMIAGVPEDFLRNSPALVDGTMPIAIEVLMRFGRWDDLLAEPAFAETLPIANALRHFARGCAYAAKGEINNAKNEQEAFRIAGRKVPEGALMMINPASKVLAIAEHMLEGEIAYREGRTDPAIAALREAVRLEDTLLYMEPPEWIQPVRHTLGAVLIDAGRFEDAEKVYRDDLRYWPENGWSLHGLAECLKKRGNTAEAYEVEKRFHKTWARADVKIGSSCLCVKKT
jgi:tetratricopeptide (TPR) repeat protein